MATYYAINAGGNWSAGGTWSTTATKDASRTGGASAPTASDDCIIDDYSGAVTINTTSCVAKSLDCTGHTGTLTFTSGQQLAVSGAVTFAAPAGMTLAGTGTLRLNTAATLTMAGQTFPGNVTSVVGGTLTLAGTLAITGTLTVASSTVFDGAYDISCATFTMTATATVQLVSGRTLTITAATNLGTNFGGNSTLRAVTASSSALIVYSGTNANCKIANMIFTDIDASGGTALLNWHGGTLTRTAGVYNVTAESFPAVADVESGVEYGGVDDAAANRLTGTYTAAGGGGPLVGSSALISA